MRKLKDFFKVKRCLLIKSETLKLLKLIHMKQYVIMFVIVALAVIAVSAVNKNVGFKLKN